MPPLPQRCVIREVGLRDGLQSIQTVLPTGHNIEWIRAAHEAGQREIEVGSFVPARRLPQLADTAELVAYAKTLPGLFVSVLVPNLKGAERALAAQADLMLVPLFASEAHSLANLRKTPDDVVAEVARIRGLALANVYAALEAGITRFDATLGGFGGCPHAPGASGNASSEDLAFMLASMGLDTGIDIERLLALRARVAQWLEGETLHGTLWRASLPKTFGAIAHRA